MSLKRPRFINGEIYHIYNRAIEGRNLFQQVADYFRFIFCLYELNDKNLVRMTRRIKQRGSIPLHSRRVLVEILVVCLMPNHYHLVVRQLVDGGISLFMKKLGDSYVGYFNLKYDRKRRGSIFQGRFQAVHVKTDDQLINLVCYIFTNPLELLEKTWKRTGIKNPKQAIKYVESYRWSSYLDCIGGTNFPSVTQRDFLMEVFGGPENIKKFVESWILYKTELRKGYNKIQNLILEK